MMNSAFRHTARAAAARARFQSTKATTTTTGASQSTSTPPISTTFLTLGKKYSTKKAWLSDPSTYPILVVMGAAGGIVFGAIAYNLAYNKDVQINPRKRNAILRD